MFVGTLTGVRDACLAFEGVWSFSSTGFVFQPRGGWYTLYRVTWWISSHAMKMKLFQVGLGGLDMYKD